MREIFVWVIVDEELSRKVSSLVIINEERGGAQLREESFQKCDEITNDIEIEADVEFEVKLSFKKNCKTRLPL